ncbi:Hypothetical protein D9617_45g091290 [Elsinoe fawcettii]|nr:Hypothetical protein D9617_45g091290 [Elsinoe fawcettii]
MPKAAFKRHEEFPLVFVKKSTIPLAGRGVFTFDTLQRGRLVGHFDGEVVREDNLEIGTECCPEEVQRIPAWSGIQVAGDKVLDTSKGQSLMRYLNHHRKPNAMIRIAIDGVVSVTTLCEIQAGSEILINYGKGADRMLAELMQDDDSPCRTLWSSLTPSGSVRYNIGDNVEVRGTRRAKWYAKIMGFPQRHETHPSESGASEEKYACLWYYDLDESAF